MRKPLSTKYPDPAKGAIFCDAQLTLSGRPVASFEFRSVPSVNTHYNKHHHARSISTAEWRYEAREEALKVIRSMGKRPEDLPLVQRALVVVNVWIPHEGIMDIHNVHIKPLLDGFSEAQLWKDDEWAFVPLVLFRWAGVLPKEKLTTIDVYELQLFQVQGEYQLLPKGRNWDTAENWDKFMAGDNTPLNWAKFMKG